ncbi:MAG: META domain-containing protein [Cognatishimia sp.]
MKKLWLFAIVLCTACKTDETLAAYGAADTTWQLTTIDDSAFAARATLNFLPDGLVRGHAPCNSFTATQTAPYPWFELTPVLSTKRACKALQAERRFFAALSKMSLAEISGDTLILSNDAGQLMLFKKTALTDDG